MSKLSATRIKVLDQFENTNGNWTYAQFETALEQSMGTYHYGNYQTAKATIVMADEAGRWPKTVKRYVLTNYSSHGNSSCDEICSRLLENMSDEEKKLWKLPNA